MNYVLPGLILLLIGYALLKGVQVYEAFVRGAAQALPLLVRILPYMAAMMVALAVFRQSGALAALIEFLSPAAGAVGLPGELVPLVLLRPFSGGAALALLQDVYAAHGPDSFAGYAASVMLGSTETIFYTISLYFGSVGISKTRHAVPVAILAGLVGVIAAIVFAHMAGV
ncbi:MAG: spore maturation protein [Christensenellaceae bacterium]|jgi:spore maturation protein B|nr:spore maturation protein [Christensenellaceae bacterium]